MGEKITLKDIAAKSGYSLRTVKKVMSGDRSVREETRNHILETGRQLGYRKNMVASVLGTNKEVRIGIVLGDYKYFFPEARVGFQTCWKAAWRDLKVELEFYTPKERGWRPTAEVLDELTGKDDIDAVIVQGNNQGNLDPYIDRLAECGKTVCTFGVDAPGSRRLFYVGPREYNGGRIAAQIVTALVNREKEICVIRHMLEGSENSRRIAGIMDYMKENYPMLPIHCVEVEDGKDAYHRKARELMANPDVAAIIGTNADCYILGEEAKKAGRKDIITLGFDLNEGTERLMKEGYFSVILDQATERQAYTALDSLCGYLLYQKETRNIYTDVMIVTGEVLRYRESGSESQT